MKRKEKKNEYLPLYWCKNLRSQLNNCVGNPTPEELFSFSDSVRDMRFDNVAEIAKITRDFGEKYPDFSTIMNNIMSISEINHQNGMLVWTETIRDFDSMANVMLWAKNKQCYKFDGDFLAELVRTENLSISKNAWDFLPFSSFYVDISENAELCQEIAGNGFFVTVDKKHMDFLDGFYNIHLCKVTKDWFFNDMITVPNADREYTLDTSEKSEIEIHDLNKGGKVYKYKQIEIKANLYKTIVVQVLNYLASAEPDIDESPETVQTYRKPSPERKVPQDKFSEIRKWEVGVRFGSAMRKWKKEEFSLEHSSSKSHRKGYTVRPHSRKAHWSHYWYKAENGGKIRRPKWIASVLVGVGKDEHSPAVIHKCS